MCHRAAGGFVVKMRVARLLYPSGILIMRIRDIPTGVCHSVAVFRKRPSSPRRLRAEAIDRKR